MPPIAPAASPWWAPHVHADRRPFLLARGRIIAALAGLVRRATISSRSRPAILQVSPGNEAHLHAFATEADRRRTARARRSTCTPRRNSPARSCWRPASARIFAFARVFRNRERGPLHHPEFTMLEWYRARRAVRGADGRLRGAAALAAEAAGHERLRFRGRTADPFAAPERLTVAEAFERFAGIDLLATLACRRPPTRRRWRRGASAGVRVADDDTWADIFSRVLVEKIEPQSRHRPRDHP